MSLVITFLGKGGTGRTTMAIAAAKKLAAMGQRVLLASQDPTPALGMRLGLPLTADPQEISANLQVVQFQSAVLLERSWEELKKLEAQYLKSPFFKAVYGQELGVLPGMDAALALNAIREYDTSQRYDAIVYDSDGDINTLRILGTPEIFSWYIRRFRQVFVDSDVWRSASPFVQPMLAAVLNVSWSGGDVFNQPAAREMTGMLQRGQEAIADPNRFMGYLVTTGNQEAIATAKYLWGSSQQVGLTVGGILVNQAAVTEPLQTEFAPLSLSQVPARSGETWSAEDWNALMLALPDFTRAAQVPRPISIDVPGRKVSLFLPGFDKKQVKLTQYGPEVTIEAGDQRRNILLPPELSGGQVTGAKFHDRYLTISF